MKSKTMQIYFGFANSVNATQKQQVYTHDVRFQFYKQLKLIFNLHFNNQVYPGKHILFILSFGRRRGKKNH